MKNSDAHQTIATAFNEMLLDHSPFIIDKDCVRLNRKTATQLGRQFIAASEQEFDTDQVVYVILRELSDLKVPVITTPLSAPMEQSLLMAWSGNDTQDHMKWLGLKESLTSSGATVTTPVATESEGSIWVRDHSLIIGNAAFVPDPEAYPYLSFKIDADKNLDIDALLPDIIKSRINAGYKILETAGLKIVPVKNLYFEGGDFIHDPQTKTIFWGNRTTVNYQEDSDKLSDAIHAEIGKRYKVRRIKTDSKHFHLDFGMSEMLPTGEFMVSGNLGYDGHRFEGYKQIENHLGRDRILRVSNQDAENLALNAKVIGDVIFMTSCSPELKRQLNQRGMKVNCPDERNSLKGWEWSQPDKFRRIGPRLAGGGVHCMTNEFKLS